MHDVLSRLHLECRLSLYREIRIENSLTAENGAHVRLKMGVEVEVTVEAKPEDTIPARTQLDRVLGEQEEERSRARRQGNEGCPFLRCLSCVCVTFRATFAKLSAPEPMPLRPLCAQWKTSKQFAPNLLRYYKGRSKPSNGTLLSA